MQILKLEGIRGEEEWCGCSGKHGWWIGVIRAIIFMLNTFKI